MNKILIKDQLNLPDLPLEFNRLAKSMKKIYAFVIIICLALIIASAVLLINQKQSPWGMRLLCASVTLLVMGLALTKWYHCRKEKELTKLPANRFIQLFDRVEGGVPPGNVQFEFVRAVARLPKGDEKTQYSAIIREGCRKQIAANDPFKGQYEVYLEYLKESEESGFRNVGEFQSHVGKLKEEAATEDPSLQQAQDRLPQGADKAVLKYHRRNNEYIYSSDILGKEAFDRGKRYL